MSAENSRLAGDIAEAADRNARAYWQAQRERRDDELRALLDDAHPDWCKCQRLCGGDQ